MEQVLTLGKNAFTLRNLLDRAAALKGVTIPVGATDAYSEKLKTYKLTPEILKSLEAIGIKRNPRSDGIFTLVDTLSTEHAPGWNPSNYWNFPPDRQTNEYNLKMELFIGFSVNPEQRGFLLLPRTIGDGVSPCDHKPNFRMFRALTDQDPKASAVAKEIAASPDGTIVVTWTDLGLGGLRSLSELFCEFVHGNDNVRALARQGIFLPDPERILNHESGNKIYVTEPAQPHVIAVWREQLKAYRDSLVA